LPTAAPTAAPTLALSPQPTDTPQPTASPTPFPLPTVPGIPSLVLEPTPTKEGVVNMSPTVNPGSNPVLDRLVAQAKNDLAGRLKISPDAATVKEAESMEWSDGSLGCAQPGMYYIQVITPGYLIVLQANGKDYEYHTSMSLAVFCK
jgi:hypothetical protein